MTAPAGSMPNQTRDDYERIRREVFAAVHGIMAAMDDGSGTGYPEDDPDKWWEAAEQAVWWHPEVRRIHAGEANKDALEQEALDEY